MDSFEATWILELHPSLHVGSSSHELSFLAFGGGGRRGEGWNQLIFPSKWCHVSLASICHFVVFNPHLKALMWVQLVALIPIGLHYFIGPWTLDPHLKWPWERCLLVWMWPPCIPPKLLGPPLGLWYHGVQGRESYVLGNQWKLLGYCI